MQKFQNWMLTSCRAYSRSIVALADGTYRYYRKDEGGLWQAVTTREFQDYFVDGTLLATRWKNQGEEELREW